ncbi:putative PLAC8 motif-containing protein [Medicago truncatula]|uniref:Plant cadmium resistance protein n=1 Tax=Medicago truncatula TaxID=3880 RepID=G7LAH4_MEDTR|nr:protein PLANT CADMIUM RESISTANCE 3 [Medicago truncatula]AET05382.1 plant cadmium resistance protein [Medicago truncatula]RHN43764.1 putative PLAC8 motif-containing protein [Medicago truncatula]
MVHNAAHSWHTGYCDCSSHCRSCCLTLFCPCVAFGRVAEIVDKGTTSCCVHGLFYCLLGGFTYVGSSLYACIYRTKLRKTYGIDGSKTCDCIGTCCCLSSISICQEFRELESRGFDVSAGWKENVRVKTRGVMEMEAPTIENGMARK